jgi:hypothetical protein
MLPFLAWRNSQHGQLPDFVKRPKFDISINCFYE